MITSIFSVSSLEYFANEIISTDPNKIIQIVRRDHVSGKRKTIQLPANKLERDSLLDEKLAIIVPNILGTGSPKGAKVWEEYNYLRKLRNDVVHMKAAQSNPRIRTETELDRESLFYRFLADTPSNWIGAAIRMIDFFAPSITKLSLDWLVSVKELQAEIE